MENYEALNLVGEGSFGRVYKARNRSSDEIVALKVIRKCGRSVNELTSLRSECEIQRQLHHPNIILMYESFETDAEIVVVTEFVKKGLHELLDEEGYFSEQKAQNIVCDLVSALYYLHSHRVLHRDLKPQNVLIGDSGVAKLCDFGFARSMSRGTHVLTSIKGTPLYMAPELIEESPYDHNVDLWSLGCIVYEMLVGTPPFTTNSILHLVRLIRHESVKWPDFLSTTCQDFLKGLLQKDPSMRLTWPYLLSHPFLKGNVNIATNESTVSGPLTCELTSSQALAKEQQRQDLAMKHGTQMKIMEQAVKKMIQQEKEITGLQEKLRVTCSLNEGSTVKGKNLCTKSLGLTGNASSRKKKHSLQQTGNVKKAGQPSRKLSSAQEGETSAQDHIDIESGNAEGCSAGTKMRRTSGGNKNDLSDSVPACEIKVLEKKDDKKSKTRLSNASVLESCHSDTLCSATPIETEEWLAFLQQSMEEVMEGDFESVSEKNFVSMVTTALTNHGASCRVTEYIACLLSLPFVADSVTQHEAAHIRKVYLEVKVIASLMYALKLLTTRPGCRISNDSSESVIDTNQLNADQLQALECLLLLVTHLVHADTAFLSQFCDAVALLHLAPRLHALLLLCKRKVRIVTDLVGILMQILKEMPENAGLVEDILLATGSPGLELHSMLTHSSACLKTRTCILIRLMAQFCCKSLRIVWTQELKNDLEILVYSSSKSIRSAAESAVQEMKKLPFYMHESWE